MEAGIWVSMSVVLATVGPYRDIYWPVEYSSIFVFGKQHAAIEMTLTAINGTSRLYEVLNSRLD